MSQGLLISGLICRPNEDGRFPILMYQHAGFNGFGADLSGDGLCQYMSDRGYAVFMSSYRGEDTAQGIVEYCAGEVDDALQLLTIARRQAYVAADLIALLGFSHGGCISLQMIARGVPAQVVVDVFGPTEWSMLYDFASVRVTQPGAYADLSKFLADATATVGTPRNNPAAYRARSPLYSAVALSNYTGAILVVHGARDEVVPPKQSCDLVRAIGGFRHSHMNFRYVPRLSERTVTSHPNECGSPDMQWADGAHPGKKDWQGERHFVFYDEMSHTSGFQLPYAIDDAENFIRTKLPGGRR
jgi:dipeptidyl aminopeptidase/acylaminoacyl peptidase